MKPVTLATVGFERDAKTTRRARFLAEMERVIPWSALCAAIKPFYPKPGNGRPPVEVERMLRIYFLQQWFNLFARDLRAGQSAHRAPGICCAATGVVFRSPAANRADTPIRHQNGPTTPHRCR
jgi:IS5 family transposase